MGRFGEEISKKKRFRIKSDLTYKDNLYMDLAVASKICYVAIQFCSNFINTCLNLDHIALDEYENEDKKIIILKLIFVAKNK